MTAVQIAALTSDEHAASKYSTLSANYHELWRDHGFMRFFALG